jgi:hypothetical protein
MLSAQESLPDPAAPVTIEPGFRRPIGLSIHPPRAVGQRLHWDLLERGIPHPQYFHLTLKYAFLPAVDLSDRLDELERLLLHRPPPLLRSNGVLASAETYCHLLLIHPSADLMRLHEDVIELFRGCGEVVNPLTARFEGAGYNPHITLSYGYCAEDFEMRDTLFAEFEPSIRFEAPSVELYEKAGESDFDLPEDTVRSFRFAAAR